MFRFFCKFLSPNQTSIKHLHVHSVESIKTTIGHELDLMTEEFKMLARFRCTGRYLALRFIYATAKGHTNHAQADQKLYFSMQSLRAVQRVVSLRGNEHFHLVG